MVYKWLPIYNTICAIDGKVPVPQETQDSLLSVLSKGVTSEENNSNSTFYLHIVNDTISKADSMSIHYN